MTNDTNPSPETSTSGSSREQHSPQRTRALLSGVLLILLLVSVVFSSIALTRSSRSKAPATITVTGSGTVQGTPDTVSFQIGVNTVAKSASGALTDNNVRVNGLISNLKSHGVVAKDLQTSGLDIYANYNNRGDITGFTASNNLDVTMHSINKAGAAIDAAARAAGNGVQLNGLTFSISNESSLLQKARVAAMHNAYSEASQVANAGNTSIGSILRITDQENVSSPPVIFKTLAPIATGVNSVPLQAGSQSVNVQVTVVYTLK